MFSDRVRERLLPWPKRFLNSARQNTKGQAR